MLKRMPHLRKNIIHVGRSKFYDSMLSLPFYFCYAVISLQIQVGTVIIWLIVGVVTCIEDKWVDLVVLEKMGVPTTEVAVMAVKEYNLDVYLASSTCPTAETYCLHPAIPLHIARRRVVD